MDSATAAAVDAYLDAHCTELSPTYPPFRSVLETAKAIVRAVADADPPIQEAPSVFASQVAPNRGSEGIGLIERQMAALAMLRAAGLVGVDGGSYLFDSDRAAEIASA
jgi:hypothetical protein